MQAVTRAATAAKILVQHVPLQQLTDVAQRGVCRAFCQLGILRRTQEAFEVVQHPVDHQALSLVDGAVLKALPDAGFVEDFGKAFVAAVDCTVEAAEEPGQPTGDVEVAALR